MLIALCLVLLLMILPLRLSLRVQHTTQTHGSLGVQAGPVKLSFPFRVARTERGGHQLTFLPRRPKEKPRPASADQMKKGMTALGTFLRADNTRKFLLKYTHLCDLTVYLHLSTSDAAKTAMLTGLIRSLRGVVPASARKRVHIAAQPDFLSGRTTGYLRCIVSLRLGILLITGGMVLAAWLMERREHPLSNKEAQQYGSSHR